MTLKQVRKEEWQPGRYIEIAMLSRSVEELIQQPGITFEEFIEDGLGRAKAAGFLTQGGRQFSIIEYLAAPTIPTTYIMSLNHAATVTDDLKDILAALGLSLSELAWVHANVNVDRLTDDSL